MRLARQEYVTDGFDSRASHSKKRRRLDDSELDSGDDEGREERSKNGLEEEEGDEEQDVPERTAVVTDIAIGRHPGPLPSDGEVRRPSK